MRGAEQNGVACLFRLRLTANVKRALERVMDSAWQPAGRGSEGRSVELRLSEWGRQRRVALLRWKLSGPLALAERDGEGQSVQSFGTVDVRREHWEFGALATSLDSDIITLGQLYRDRGDSENAFDELKNQWGWGGFTTQDPHRCQLMARSVGLVFDWWNLFARLADPHSDREAITSRPRVLSAIERLTTHARRVTLHVRSLHGQHAWARRAFARIAAFFVTLRETAEQLTPLDRWYRILSLAMMKYLHGHSLEPPRRLQAIEATAMG